MDTFGYEWILDTVWIRLDTFGYVWIRLDTFEYVWIRFSRFFGYVWIRKSFGYVWIRMHMFEYVWICGLAGVNVWANILDTQIFQFFKLFGIDGRCPQLSGHLLNGMLIGRKKLYNSVIHFPLLRCASKSQSQKVSKSNPIQYGIHNPEAKTQCNPIQSNLNQSPFNETNPSTLPIPNESDPSKSNPMQFAENPIDWEIIVPSDFPTCGGRID